MNFKNIFILALLAITLTGCISPKTYVDPSFSKASYEDVAPVKTKYQSTILVEFQRNGQHFSRADSELRGHVERTLRASGVVVPGDPSSIYSIKVVVNNIADMGEAAAKGVGTGLTFGAAGSLVTDYYEATIEFIDENGTKHVGTYKHALHTTIGNKKAPFENVQPTTPADGFGTVVEQTLLNFIKEMQDQGILTFNALSNRTYS